MEFERFVHTGKSFTPAATISAAGLLSFNEGAKHRFKLDRYTHVVLLFNRPEQVVALLFTRNETEEGAMKLRHRRTGADVSVKSFLSYYEIEIPKTKKYPVQEDSDSGMVVVSLNDPKAREVGGASEPKSDSEAELEEESDPELRTNLDMGVVDG